MCLIIFYNNFDATVSVLPKCERSMLRPVFEKLSNSRLELPKAVVRKHIRVHQLKFQAAVVSDVPELEE